MADLLQTGSDWLEDQRTEHCSKAVTYHRGGDSVQVQATIGRTEFEVQTEHGVIEKYESRDFLVLAEDLVLSSQQTVPQDGDRIKEAIGGDTLVFEVMAPGEEPPWRYSDPYHKTLRIHTKQVDTE